MRDLFNLMIMFSRAGLLISPNSYPTLSTQTTRPARLFYFGSNKPFRAVICATGTTLRVKTAAAL